MKTHITRSNSGFTLLELLIVIGIIAILASVAFPVTGLVIDKARGTEATNEAHNIVNAVKAYEMDYSKYPLESGAAGEDTYETTTNQAFMKIILGKDLTLNPRGNVYYEGKTAREGVNGLDYGEDGASGGNPRMVDPWGNEYFVQIDGDYNNSISGPEDCDGNEIRLGVIAWSKGKPKSTGDEDEGATFKPCSKWSKSW